MLRSLPGLNRRLFRGNFLFRQYEILHFKPFRQSEAVADIPLTTSPYLSIHSQCQSPTPGGFRTLCDLVELPWSQIMIFLIIALSLAMVSNVEYARLPRIGFRTLRGLSGLSVHLIILWFGIFNRDIFFFPLAIAYVSYGLGRGAVLAFIERGEEDIEEVEGQPQLIVHEADDRQRKPAP